MESFAVRHVIEFSGMFEERVTLWEALSAWIHRRNGCVDRVVTGQMPSDLG